MGITAMVVQHVAGKLPGLRHAAKWPFAAKSFSGLLAGATFTAGGLHAHYKYGHEYGNGVTAMYAVASVIPVVGVPMVIMEGGKQVGDAFYRHQRAKRQSSFTKSAVPDRFGTIHRMRQHSIQQLSRDHTSKQRVLGYEASLLHR